MLPPSPSPIHIDPRSGSGPLLPLFQSHRLHPPCQHTTLPAADFSFIISGPDNLPTLVGVERKTITDMMSSIRKKRLSGEQLPKLISHYQHFAYIVLEGIYRVNPASGFIQQRQWWEGKREWMDVMLGRNPFHAQEMEGALHSIANKTPVKLWRTSDPQSTVDWVVGMWYWGQKEWSDHQAHLGIYVPPPVLQIGKTSTVRRFAYACTGVGWDKSGVVEENFASLPDMLGVKEFIPFKQHVKTWEKLDGFGKVLSEKVLRELRGEIKE